MAPSRMRSPGRVKGNVAQAQLQTAALLHWTAASFEVPHLALVRAVPLL